MSEATRPTGEEDTWRPVRDENGWGQLRMERVPDPGPNEARTTALMNTLSQAWPVLAKHASHMDGTFDLALTDLRSEVAGLYARLAALRARLDRAEGENADRTENVARAIYDAMRENDPEGKSRPWVERGNSEKQDEARRRARAALSTPTPPTTEPKP